MDIDDIVESKGAGRVVRPLSQIKLQNLIPLKHELIDSLLDGQPCCFRNFLEWRLVESVEHYHCMPAARYRPYIVPLLQQFPQKEQVVGSVIFNDGHCDSITIFE